MAAESFCVFEARFRLRHSGCWTAGLAKFKSEFVTRFTAATYGDFVQDVLEVKLAGKGEGARILRYLRASPVVKKVEVAEESEAAMLLQVFTDTSCIRSVVKTVLRNGCFPSENVRVSGGREVWTIAAPRKTAISNALDELRGMGALELVSIKKSSMDGLCLSPKQEEAVKKAMELGYYETPRKHGLDAVAKALGVSKATAAEHIRKAEAKVLKKTFFE